VTRYGIDSYLEWVKNEGMRVHEGVAIDLFAAETAHLRGRGDCIVPAMQQHMYDLAYKYKILARPLNAAEVIYKL
jgi:hypothetical protein